MTLQMIFQVYVSNMIFNKSHEWLFYSKGHWILNNEILWISLYLLKVISTDKIDILQSKQKFNTFWNNQSINLVINQSMLNHFNRSQNFYSLHFNTSKVVYWYSRLEPYFLKISVSWSYELLKWNQRWKIWIIVCQDCL